MSTHDIYERQVIDGEIVNVLVSSTPIAVAPSAADVREEAQRRMMLLVGARDADHLDVLVSNGTREAVRLLRLKSSRVWTSEEAQRAALLEATDAAIEAIRAASNALEPNPPADYAADARWPATS